MHKLEPLPYPYGFLEPYIDSKTMEIHHDKHHQTYVDKLNAALEKYPELQKKKVNELLENLNKIPEEIRNAVRNNGGGHANHSFFWPLLKKNAKFEGDIAEAIKKRFGSFDKFKEEFSNAAINRFGSGWAWLVLDKDKLEIVSSANQDSPLSEGKIPLLTLDVWEHSYYLKYQNRRAEYVDAFFNIINWERVNEHYVNAIRNGKNKKRG